MGPKIQVPLSRRVPRSVVCNVVLGGKTKAREVRAQEESVDVDVVLCKSELVVRKDEERERRPGR